MINIDLYNSYKLCQQLFLKHSKSYYLGAMLFNFEKFKHICAFYGLVRTADDIVDNSIDLNEKKAKLTAFCYEFFTLYDLYYINQIPINSKEWEKYHPIMKAVFHTITIIGLPRNLFERFFNSMKMDLQKHNYKTFTELEEYMDGSASVVGEIMMYIMAHNCDYYDSDKFKTLTRYSRDLGIAFQLTNFIRDIKEDLIMIPPRIYIPKYFLDCYDINFYEYNKTKIIDAKFKDFMKCQFDLNKEIYNNAQFGINELHPEHRLAIQTSKNLYSEILVYIEKADYDVFGKKILVPFQDKLKIMYKTLSIFHFFKMMFNYITYTYFTMIHFLFNQFN